MSESSRNHYLIYGQTLVLLAASVVSTWAAAPHHPLLAWTSVGLALLASLGIVYQVQRHIRALRASGELLKKRAANDLTEFPPPRSVPRELRPILDSVASMEDSTIRLVERSRHLGSLIARASKVLHDSCADIRAESAKGAGANASIAAALEEMESSLASISGNAEEIRLAATRTAESAKRVNNSSFRNSLVVARHYMGLQEAATRLREATESVGGLASAGDGIGGLAGEIQDISRRTRLLALNAAIEAQRAGAAGRGFAVVAGEVKELAEQASGMATRIQSQVEGITQGTHQVVERMSRLREGLDGSIVEVVDAVVSSEHLSALSNEVHSSLESTRDRFAEIAHALEESHLAARELGSNALDVDRGAQQIGTAISCAQEESRSLEQFALSLDETTRPYKLPPQKQESPSEGRRR